MNGRHERGKADREARGCPPKGFRSSNHFAIAGFLFPFAAAGLTAALVLAYRDAVSFGAFRAWYLTIVPLTLMTGLAASIRSIALIERLDDRDYAYAGLFLNAFFLLIYAASLILLFRSPH